MFESLNSSQMYYCCATGTGLASSQHVSVWEAYTAAATPLLRAAATTASGSTAVTANDGAPPDDESNNIDALMPTDPYHNVSTRRVAVAKAYYQNK